MKINKYNLLIIGLILILSLYSCEDEVTGPGLQDSPNSFGDAPAVNILGQAKLQMIMMNGSDFARYAGILSNQLNGASAQWQNYNNYDLTFGDFDALWDNSYQDGLAQAQIAKAKAIELGNDDLEATAQLLEAYFIGELATFFGDVPYTEANNPNIDNPKFDSQESVLNAAITLLNGVISKSNSNIFFNDGIGGTSTSADLSEIANSLKARYYMVLKDYPNALTSAKNGIKSKADDLISSFTTATGGENLFYQFGVDQRPGNIEASGSYLFDLLTNSTRRLTTPGDSKRSAYYFDGIDLNFTENGLFSRTADIPLVTWYETKLIEAEAEERTGGNGLMAFNAVRTELASQFTDTFPASTATGNDLLRDILEEKYITLFPSPVSFQDLQRTNNFINVSIKKGTVFPERFLYPESETSSNSSINGPFPDLFTETPVNQ